MMRWICSYCDTLIEGGAPCRVCGRSAVRRLSAAGKPRQPGALPGAAASPLRALRRLFCADLTGAPVAWAPTRLPR